MTEFKRGDSVRCVSAASKNIGGGISYHINKGDHFTVAGSICDGISLQGVLEFWPDGSTVFWNINLFEPEVPEAARAFAVDDRVRCIDAESIDASNENHLQLGQTYIVSYSDPGRVLLFGMPQWWRASRFVHANEETTPNVWLPPSRRRDVPVLAPPLRKCSCCGFQEPERRLGPWGSFAFALSNDLPELLCPTCGTQTANFIAHLKSKPAWYNTDVDD